MYSIYLVQTIYVQNDNLLFSNDFTQNIPCHARRYFLEHVLGNEFDQRVFRRIHDHAPQIEVVIESLKQPGPKYTVQVTNEENDTSFSGAAWMQFVTHYKMKVRDKLFFFLDHAHRMTYFKYVDPNNSEDSTGEDDA